MDPVTLTFVCIGVVVGWCAIGSATAEAYIDATRPTFEGVVRMLSIIFWPVTLGLLIGVWVNMIAKDPRDGFVDRDDVSDDDDDNDSDFPRTDPLVNPNQGGRGV